jgi:hypothetical protein
MIDDFDLEEDKEYPEELYPVLELSDSILELTEKLELIRGKLDDFEQRYLEADEELRECEGYEIPSSSIIERWQNTIEEISDQLRWCAERNRIELLGDPL